MFPGSAPVIMQVLHRSHRDDYPIGEADGEVINGHLIAAHTVPVHHKGELEHYIQDFVAADQAGIRKAAEPHLPEAPVKNSSDAVGAKIKKIEHEGIRGKHVPHKQAVAAAINMVKNARPKEAESEQLLAAIRANPDESTGWLAYADWLDEHGHDTEASRIRWWEGAKEHLRSKAGTLHEATRRSGPNAYYDLVTAYAALPEWVGRLTAIHGARRLLAGSPALGTDQLRNTAFAIGEQIALGLHDERERRRVRAAANETHSGANHWSAGAADWATSNPISNTSNDLIARHVAHQYNDQHAAETGYAPMLDVAHHVADYIKANPPPQETPKPTQLARSLTLRSANRATLEHVRAKWAAMSREERQDHLNLRPGETREDRLARVRKSLLSGLPEPPASAAVRDYTPGLAPPVSRSDIAANPARPPVTKRELAAGLRKPKLARVQAPAGGMVVNNQYAEGGQFVARAFQRIRDVVKKRWKLDRHQAEEGLPAWVTEHITPHDDRVASSPEDNPHRPVMSVPALLAGERPGPEGRLTLGQLKRIEDAHGLPASERLSPHVAGAAGQDDRPFTASVERIATFFQSLGKHRLSDHALKTVLRDPNRQPQEKIAHLVSHLGHELADYRGASKANGNEWYGEKVNHMDRVLHSIFASGASDPMWGTLDSRGELKGKHDPAAHHPAMVLFKALIAGTSAGQNPIKNLLTAYHVWQKGRKANPENPIAGMPMNQHEYLSDWWKKLEEANGAPVPQPPIDWNGKAAWYAKYVYPYRQQLSAREGQVGYSSVPAQIIVHNRDDHPHHGVLVSAQERGRWVRNRKAPSRTSGRTILVDLPRHNADGSVKAKAWAKISPEPQIKKLQALVAHFGGPGKSTLETYRDAARWLLTEHTSQEIDALSKATGGRVPSAARHRSGTFLTPHDLVPGSFMFGPKFGPFMLNLHMNSPETREPFGKHLTADKWWTRLWNRYTNRLLDIGRRKPQAKDINEAPAGMTERKAMADAARTAAKAAGVGSVAELQADLWYYEQALWRMFGGEKMDSYDFAHAADLVKQRHEEGPQRLARRIGPPPPEGSDTEHDLLLRAHHAEHEETGENGALAGLSDYLEENNRPGAHLARKGLAEANWTPWVGGRDWQSVPRDWMELSGQHSNTQPGLMGNDAIDLEGPMTEERKRERERGKTPVFSRPGNLYVQPFIAAHAVQDIPAYLSVTHVGDTMGLHHETGQAWTRYHVPVRSKAHLAEMTSDLPEAMRAEIHRRLDPFLPETHES